MSKHRADAPVKVEELEGSPYPKHALGTNTDKQPYALDGVLEILEGDESKSKAAVLREIVNNYSKLSNGLIDKGDLLNVIGHFNKSELDAVLSYTRTKMVQRLMY